MSFESEYEKLRKKRLKEAEESQKSTSKKSFAEQYDEAKSQWLATEKENANTVAFPTYMDLKQRQKESDTPLPLLPTLLRGNMSAGELHRDKEAWKANAKKFVTPEESTIFQSGAFDDGYQFGDVFKSVIATAGDTILSGAQGFGNFFEGIFDLAAYGTGEVADWLGMEDVAEQQRKAAEYEGINTLFDFLRDQNKKLNAQGYAISLEDNTLLGDKGRGFAETLGGVGGMIATAGLGGAVGLSAKGASALGTASTFASSTGSGIDEAYKAGATDEDAWKYGATKGVIDAGTELMFGGLGKGFGALGIGKSAIPIDDILAKKLTKNISNVLAKNSIQLGVKGAAEGVEELAAGYLTAHAQKGTFKSEEDFDKLIEDQDLLEQFVMGALAGGMVSSVNLPSSVKSGRDYITGLTANEQTVVDAEIANRIAEQEKDGTTLTKKDKSKIESEVLEDLKKGYISTDTIESALGGDTYKSYQDTVTNEESILKEYEELGNKQNATLAEQSRYAELQEMVKDIKDNSKRTQLQAQMSEEVQKSLVRDNNGKVQTDDFLLESYNERARRGQTFEADVSKYDAKQQATIQKAIDSGILNNTRRTHDFVDMVAKISAEKGVLFDFANNEKIKESGFAKDGKFVNGYVTKDGVTLNINSSKSLNSVVGHEITHVLEGTELYTELQNAIKDYAVSKKDYKKRLDTLKKLYKGVEGADIDAELTADLVGDYLFTDSDFISHLSTKNRNVFQKIYDEIKYLCKIATAGSKEARQLEKVKKAFDKAYRESSKATGDTDGSAASETQYSVSVTDKKTIDFLDNQEHIVTYKSMQVIDGKLYPPMAAKVKGADGKYHLNTPSQLGVWQQATEDPSNIKKIKNGIGYYTLNKGDGTSIDAAYNPYEHSSNLVLNDQFESAHRRNNLVTVECIIPVSEMSSGYRAQYAKDSTGVMDWKAGVVAGQIKDNKRKVYLSRYLKPVRILSDAETAQKYKDILDGTGVSVPFNVVSPSLLTELEKVGVDIDYDGSPMYQSNQKRKAEKEAAKNSTKYSLSAEQQEYFKDSKVRDENGNLKVMYHGTSKGGHTVFDTYGSNYGLFGQGSYFTDNKSVAESYTNKGKGNNKQVYESYLNITNPIDMDAQADADAWKKALPEADFPESGTNEQFYRAMEEHLADEEYPKWEAAEIAMDVIQSMGYDGITHIGGGRVNADGTRHQVYIAFEPEQIKNIDNLKPTSDPDIRYSLSEDSEGNALTDGQKEYFKDSKAVDENGNLLKVYHTTKNDFTVFDKARKGEATEDANTYLGFFFADDSEYMSNFPEFKNGKTEAYYLNMTNPIDMTNISREAFSDIVDVMGGDIQEAIEVYDEEGGGQLGHLLDAMTGEFSYQDFIKELQPHYAELMSRGYDGVVNYLDEDYGAKEYIVLDSNQAKLTTNTDPTANADIRYSLSSIANTFFGDENMNANEFAKVDYKQTQQYKDYVNQCLNNMRQSRIDFDEEVTRKEIEDSIEGIIRVAIASKNAGYDIYDDASKRNVRDSKNRLLFSSLEPNSDYFTSNDISSICDKRKNFAEIYDDIVKGEEAKGVPQGKRFFDNVDNYFYLHNVLAEKGLTQPCRECYVESMRKNLAPMANAFLKLVKETDANNIYNDQLYHQKGKNKGELKSSNASTREWVLEKFQEYDMTVGDLSVETLTTAEGLAQLKIQAPMIYEAFNSFYGQSKPKMPRAATPFRFGELTALLTDHNGNINKRLVEKINSTGGFRLQSYSDFQIQNYTDTLQVLFEAGTLGLKGHSYTKVPAFLEATDGTNLKRNISIFMYKDGYEWKLDRNDSFPYTLEEIYELVKADKNGNTGIVAVSQNEDMSAWIMANDLVGYGIPFHKSGMKMGTVRDTDVKTEDGRIIKGYSGTKDHTKQQAEVYAKSSADHKALTKVKKGINIYSFWDFDNKSNLSKNELIEKNVKAYIDACETSGYLPKFRDYVMNNSKVLNNVLNYSKKLGFVSQDATIKDISFEYKGYTIPYGYYKFLGDFGMFTSDGKASSQEVLSLKNYDFDKAVQFFADSETLHRNEILQQFANGEERERYRNSNLNAGQLEEIVRQRRNEVAQEIVGRNDIAPVKNSLSFEGETPKEYGNFNFYGKDMMLDTSTDIAPVQEDVTEKATTEGIVADDIAPTAEYEAIKPMPEQLEDEEAQWSKNKMARADEDESASKGKRRKFVKSAIESDAVDGAILFEDLNPEKVRYQPISNKATLNNANTKLGNMGYEKSVTYFNSQFANKNVSLDDIALGERLIQEAVKRGDTQTAGELIQNVAILGTELGQKVQALSIIKRLTPEGQLGMLKKTIERGKTKGDKTFEGVELTQEMIDKILATYNKDGGFDQNKLNGAVEDVKKQIAGQMKVTKMEKANAWRYLSMLGNPKTHIRNLVSNIAMRGTVAAKNVVARTIESIAPIKNRTKTFKSASNDVKAFVDATTNEMKDIISGDSKYSENASIKSQRAIFKNKILNGVYEFNSNMLSKEDWWFSKPAFKNALSEYLTANGILTKQDIENNPKIVAKAKNYALEQSQIATFRQYSWLANKINEIERKNAATNIAVGAILPFKKTPVNIAKTALNYSPLGFMKTLTYDALQVKKGNMEASAMIDNLSQNITGSALSLVGYLLASAGFLNGAGEDDKEGKYDYQLGEQAYSVNIGGATFSLSWLSPVAMPLFVGVNAYEQLVEGKEWNGDVVVETLSQTLDPLSEMSFLSSLDDVLSSYDSGIEKFAGIGESMAQSYVSQFIPTLSSQVASVMDDTKRSTKAGADSGFKFYDETINKLKYKIPFLRETLEPTTDIWGNEVKQTDNAIERAFETFLAPYAKRENIASAVDEEIKALYRETGDNGLIPNVPYNYINYDGEKYEMSASEHTKYKKTYGQTAFDLLDELFATNTYQNATSEERADMLNDVYDYARDEATKEYLAKNGVEYTNATSEGEEYYRENAIKGAIENDMPIDEYKFSSEYPEKYAVAKSVGGYDAYKTYSSELYDIKADKDENGKSISGSRKEKVLEYINNLDADYGEKLILFKSEYNADDTYNYEIIDYLNSREDISYEEMETILKELGFTVKADGKIEW